VKNEHIGLWNQVNVKKVIYDESAFPRIESLNTSGNINRSARENASSRLQEYGWRLLLFEKGKTLRFVSHTERILEN